MPTATRRQVQAHYQRMSNASVDISNDDPPDGNGDDETIPDPDMEAELQDAEDEVEEGEDDGQDIDQDDLPFPPPGLKEISSLASWTVSTAKPGNGVAALRSPDLQHFWQSDGPQPHLLTIHFFKLVAIVHMRVFLDFAHDESYTPTKIQFLAGMAGHDMQEFAEMTFEQPQGWIDVDFGGVGPIVEEERDSDEENGGREDWEVDWSKRPVLRAFVVQVKILENHQNGKDTHLRAVQLFAKDETARQQLQARLVRKKLAREAGLAAAAAAGRMPLRTKPKQKARKLETNTIKLADWMMDPDMR